MKKLVLTLAIIIIGSIEISSHPAIAQSLPTRAKAGGMKITKGPDLESATPNSAIIRWTTNIGGSRIVSAVVHYGVDPKNLNQTAQSSNRWNPNLPYMTQRVFVPDLKPGTTYYYTVESKRGDGVPLGGKSTTVRQFTTPASGPQS
jgi:hypothetical protein